ncbi:MAG: hypothetical protein ACYC49_14910 [Ignavibacteriaceae bacterium]
MGFLPANPANGASGASGASGAGPSVELFVCTGDFYSPRLDCVIGQNGLT